jgi:hypothetical protein
LASLRYLGAAIEAGRRRGGARLVPHASIGVNYIDGAFQVNAVTDAYRPNSKRVV